MQAAGKVKEAVTGAIRRHDSQSSSDEEFFEQAGAATQPSSAEGNQAGLGFGSETVSQNELRAQVSSFFASLIPLIPHRALILQFQLRLMSSAVGSENCKSVIVCMESA